MISSTLHPLNVLPGRFPEVEEAAQVFPVSLYGGEANLADQALPLWVEVILPGELVEVTLKNKNLISPPPTTEY